MGNKKKAKASPLKRAKVRPKKGMTHKRPMEKNDEIFGFMAGQFEIVGDIESPLKDWEHWDPAKNLEE